MAAKAFRRPSPRDRLAAGGFDTRPYRSGCEIMGTICDSGTMDLTEPYILAVVGARAAAREHHKTPHSPTSGRIWVDGNLIATSQQHDRPEPQHHRDITGLDRNKRQHIATSEKTWGAVPRRSAYRRLNIRRPTISTSAPASAAIRWATMSWGWPPTIRTKM